MIPSVREESIFDELERSHLVRQDFGWAVFLCVASALFTLLTVFAGPDIRAISQALGSLVGILSLFPLKKYLRNFDLPNSDKWINPQFGLGAVVLVLTFYLVFQPSGWHHYFGLKPYPFAVWVFGFNGILVMTSCLFSLLLGREILQMRNDFVGRLRHYGASIVYLVPAITILILALYTYQIYIGRIPGWFKVPISALRLLYMLPAFLLARVYYCAYLYQKNSGNRE